MRVPFVCCDPPSSLASAQSAAPSRELADAFLADFESDDDGDDAQNGGGGGDGADAAADADGADDSDSDSMDGDDGDDDDREKSGDGKKSATDNAVDDEEDAVPLTDKTFELVVRLLDDPRLPAHFAKLERLNAGAAAATREEEYPVIVASNQVLGLFV